MNQNDRNDQESFEVGWGTVFRDVLEFQFKLVVDGLKDLSRGDLKCAFKDFAGIHDTAKQSDPLAQADQCSCDLPWWCHELYFAIALGLLKRLGEGVLNML